MSDPRELLGPALVAAVQQVAVEAALAALAELPTEETWSEYMDAPTAARYLGVAEERVRKLQAAGKLACCQEAPGHRVTYPRDGLDRLMAMWRVEAER